MFLKVNTAAGLVQILTTNKVNERSSPQFWAVSSLVYSTTAGLNLVLVVLLAWRDRTPVNILMMVDCAAGCLQSVLTAFFNSPTFQCLDLPAVCAATVMLVNWCILLNRCVPVAIAVYRYLLVCHAPRMLGQEATFLLMIKRCSQSREI